MSRKPHDALIVFTRLPRAGQAKTRLIPQLGAEGAASLQRRMTRHTVGRAWACSAGGETLRLRIAYEGGSQRELRNWLGGLPFFPQGGGSLGERLTRCIQHEFAAGASTVIVIGTDCPRLNESHIQEARRALLASPLVFGPAQDGGYYLVGLARDLPGLFDGIEWGTGRVLAQSLEFASRQGIEPALLPELPDVDLPADLPDAEAALSEGRTVSIIIPALNEAANLDHLLPKLRSASPHEIIVADGGSDDATVEIAARHGARVVRSERGRACQMNSAAREASGEHLLFLHADTDPPPGCCRLVADCLEQAGVTAGAFRFALREPIPGGGLIQRLVAVRCATSQMPYGDQGLFLRRWLFEALGGFPEWSILEDVELVRRLRQAGRIAILPEAAPTSSRRWKADGVMRTFLRHQMILLGNRLGISPEKLAGWR